MGFLWAAIAIVSALVSLVSAFLMKTPKPPEIKQDFQVPENEIGTDIPVIFGQADTTFLVAWWGDVGTQKRKVASSGKK